MSQPTSVKVKVTNWDTYQPRADVKRPSWFRVDFQMIEHPEFFTLTHEEFRAWIYILAQCCKRNSATVILNFEQADRICGVTRTGLLGCIEKLSVSDVLSCARDEHERGRNVRVTDTDATRRDSTLRDETRRDETVPAAPPPSGAWEGYRDAYHSRYGTDPQRNAMVNSQLKQFTARVPAGEAADIAAFYVRHNDAFYVRQMHPVGLLLKDAEKLRTEWFTGNRMTGTKARDTEKKQAIVDVWGPLIAEAEAKDGKR